MSDPSPPWLSCLRDMALGATALLLLFGALAYPLVTISIFALSWAILTIQTHSTPRENHG